MIQALAVALSLWLLSAPAAVNAAPPIYKCVRDGAVTYQNDPCPAVGPRTVPTVDQLNAERRKKLREAADASAGAQATGNKGQFSTQPGMVAEALAPYGRDKPGATAAPAAAAAPPFRCDGRIHCSQMTSCAEAKLFLNSCPGVKMDGDRDGIPCEDQWCKGVPR